nr:oligosaccharide flippase family protein [Holdemania massiliensis]
MKNNQLFRESGSFFLSEGVGLFFAMLILVFRGRFLSADDLGMIDYVTSIVAFTSAFFLLGIDNTGARLIINEKNELEKKQLAGMTMLLAVVLMVVYVIFMAVFTMTVPLWGRADSVSYIYIILPFAGYSILLLCYKQLCFALGDIRQASIQLFISYVLYFVVLLVLRFTNLLNLYSALVFSFGINLATIVIPMYVKYGCFIKWNKSSWLSIKKEQHERGWKIYFSRVVFSSASNLDTLILGVFNPLSTVAYFSIAKYCSMVISMVGNSVSQSMYRKYAEVNEISKKLIKSIVLLTVILAGVIFCITYIVVLIMGSEYFEVMRILPIAIISQSIASINAIYNSFMNAKGMANELRVLAFIGVAGRLVFDFALIIPFGALGGLCADLLVNIFVFTMRVYYCRRYKNKQKLL